MTWTARAWSALERMDPHGLHDCVLAALAAKAAANVASIVATCSLQHIFVNSLELSEDSRETLGESPKRKCAKYEAAGLSKLMTSKPACAQAPQRQLASCKHTSLKHASFAASPTDSFCQHLGGPPNCTTKRLLLERALSCILEFEGLECPRVKRPGDTLQCR